MSVHLSHCIFRGCHLVNAVHCRHTCVVQRYTKIDALAPIHATIIGKLQPQKSAMQVYCGRLSPVILRIIASAPTLSLFYRMRTPSDQGVWKWIEY